MDAKELQVGNWVNNSLAGNVCLTNELLWPLIKFGSQGTADLKEYYDRHSFIQLNRDWFLEFGFALNTFRNEWEHKDCEFTLKKMGNYYYPQVCGNFDTIELCELQYVHQLQNLFYLLTKKQLIKRKT